MSDKMPREYKQVFGTWEWADKTANCVHGCQHDCKYCYAKAMAIRFKRKTPTTWKVEKARLDQIQHVCSGKPCRVMFPSSHDITPDTLLICLEALDMMLRYGHALLIVSKPHLECIEAICGEFGGFRDRILFRFTIGSADNDTLAFWEPNAPAFDERLQSLKLACRTGFDTSVSCEPMLDENVEAVVKEVSPFVTDSVWIGKAHQLRQRLTLNGAPQVVLPVADSLLASQNDDAIIALYARSKDNPKIRWKESIKKVVGLPAAERPGLDTDSRRQQ